MIYKYSPALVCGFAAAVLVTIPGFKNLACCFIVPLASVAGLYVEQRIQGEHRIMPSNAFITGLLAGISSAIFGSFFEILITALTKTHDIVQAYPELEKFLNSLNMQQAGTQSLNLFKRMINEITTKGFSMTFAIILIFSNLLVNSLMGIVGDLSAWRFLTGKSARNNYKCLAHKAEK